MSYILSLATFLTILQVLDYFNPVYLIQINRFWEPTDFNTNVHLITPLAILSLVIIFWISVKNLKFALIPLLGLSSLLYLPFVVSIVLVCHYASLPLSS
jgi:hypothetical protein